MRYASHTLSPGSVLAIVGSRSRPATSTVSAVLAAARATSVSMAVGCARGVDQSALLAAVRLRVPVRVFSVGGPASPSPAVAAAIAAGAGVSWWAGGGAHVPYRARLVRRSQAVVLASSAVFAVFGSNRSRGTLGACRFAIGKCKPVFAVALPGVQLPALGAGQWQRAQLLGVSCWRWVAGQGEIF